ncbi:hypothetical protein ACQ4PT_033077 [Festuca glaucescens]
MAEEVIKEVNTSTPAPAESKRDIFPINITGIIHGNSIPPYLRTKEKPVPHYRRASTGSCHDSCKFGTHHSSESKKDEPSRPWRQDRANARHGKQDQAELVPPGGKSGKKDPGPKIVSHVNKGSGSVKPGFTKQKPPLKVVTGHSESSPCVELPDEVSEDKCLIMSFDDRSNCGDEELSEGAVSIDLEMPLAIQDNDESDDHVMDSILPSEDVRKAVEQSLVDHVSGHSAIQCVSSEKRSDQTVMAPEKHKKTEHETKSESFSRGSVKPKTKATSTATRNTVSSHKTGVKSQQKVAGTSVESSDRPRTIAKKADVSATSKFNGDKKPHLIVASTFLKLKEIKVPSPASAIDSKSTRFSKLKASATKIAPATSPTSGKQTGRKMAEENVARKDSLLGQKKGEEKVTILTPLKLSRSINMSAKSLLSPRIRGAKKATSASPMKSKKVYGIESSSVHKEKIVKTASPKIRKPDVNNKERKSHKEKAVVARTESAGRPKPASISSSTTRQLPRKLTFLRGKVLTKLASSADSNSPRRVRFRPAKTTDDSNISKDPTRGRIARKRGAVASVASRDSGTSRAEVVVLRHQGANEKKSEQRSLNKVIKETASRLVEARKSKVKALVGAFETVISLQENRGRSSSVSIS